MRKTAAPAALGAALLATAACSADRRGDPAGAMPREDPASTEEAATVVYCVINAHTDPGTVHFQGPDWLLSASEGRGPQQLNVRIDEYLQPVVSTSGSFKLDPSALSTSVGYSMGARYQLQASGGVTVSSGAFRRLEAYTAFQRTIWEVRDASCTTVLGRGASFKPIGVFFQVVSASSVALPDLGVYVAGSVDEGPAVVPWGTGPATAGDGADAGGNDGGEDAGDASDAGDAGDAGAGDGG